MSHPTSDEPPSVKDELERKTVDLLETLVHRAETHRMSQADLSLAAKTLWNVTSGLVSSEISRLCSAAAETAPASARMKRHFVGKGKVLSVVWLPDGAGYAVITTDAAQPLVNRIVRPVKSEVGMREAELSSLFTALLNSGYVEI